MQNLRVFVEDAAYAMATVFAHHGIMIFLCVLLDGVAYIAQLHAGFYQLNTFVQALLGDLTQAVGVGATSPT